jgi:hypothetical protein
MSDNNWYSFNTKSVDGQSLIHVINLLFGDGIEGVELGTYQAQSACTILQNCPNVKKLWIVDSFTPYTDYIQPEYTGQPAKVVTAKEMDVIRFLAYHNVAYSGAKERAEILEMTTTEALSKFKDNSLDFIFSDAYLSYEQVCSELEEWYSKLRPGGLYAGHDMGCPIVYKAVMGFREKHGITAKISIFDDTWMWIK